jgi:hypothetical protein
MKIQLISENKIITPHNLGFKWLNRVGDRNKIRNYNLQVTVASNQERITL